MKSRNKQEEEEDDEDADDNQAQSTTQQIPSHTHTHTHTGNDIINDQNTREGKKHHNTTIRWLNLIRIWGAKALSMNLSLCTGMNV